MTRAARARLVRDPALLITIVALWALLTLFVIYPLLMLAATAFSEEGRLALNPIASALQKPGTQRAFLNSLLLGTLVGVVGTAPDKAGVLSFVLDGVRIEDVSGILDQEGIAVRSGHHCAQPILRRFGVESTVRPSLAFYNTCADVDALIASLQRIVLLRGHKPGR